MRNVILIEMQLKSFSVKGFGPQSADISLDLTYDGTGRKHIANGVVTKAVLYGPSGSGKTTLARALLDIGEALTGRPSGVTGIQPRPGMDDWTAQFRYEFLNGRRQLVYEYRRGARGYAADEKLTFDGDNVPLIPPENRPTWLPGATPELEEVMDFASRMVYLPVDLLRRIPVDTYDWSSLIFIDGFGGGPEQTHLQTAMKLLGTLETQVIITTPHPEIEQDDSWPEYCYFAQKDGRIIRSS
jgi:energy-coupling factor transporter ATP-binding protein EcfA2